jgi:hypothetical protein
MGRSARLTKLGALACLGALVLAAGCSRQPAEEGVGSLPVAPAVSASASAHRPDQLAPGELLEGQAKAFGVALPRDLSVEASFADVVYASGRVGVHPLVEFFRARLTEGSVREGPEAATFEHVRAPAVPERELRVRILPHEGGARVELRDTTPPALPVLPEESARWRQVGLTPNGRLADPRHLD